MPKLTYWNIDGGRGEDCRIALHLAGVDFEDHRITGKDWSTIKPQTPFGVVPTLELDEGVLSDSNAILIYIGRVHGMHPEDPFEAAVHEGMMGAVEDLRRKLEPTLRMKDNDEKKAAREALVADYLPGWARSISDRIAGPFVAGDTLSVVDLKLFVAMRWIVGGGLDFVPPEVLGDYPAITTLYETVARHKGVRGWYEKRSEA